MSGAKIVWANDTAGVARYILEVRSGLECHCVCPGCGALLEAVNSENPYWKKRPHFRHYQAPELEDCAASAVLSAAREVVRTLQEIKLPAYEVKREVTMAAGSVVTGTARTEEVVVRVEAAEFVDATDAILTLADGQRVRLRLVARTIRTEDPSQPVMGEIAIDLRDPVLQTADPQTLRQYITLDSSSRRWCHFANQEALEKLAFEDATAQWERLVAHQASAPPERTAPTVPTPVPVRPISTSTFIKRHIPVSDMSASLKALGQRYKPIHCYWCPGAVDTRRWRALIPTWEVQFGMLFEELLDAGMTAREQHHDATAALAKASDDYGFSPQAIIGLWLAAGIARR